jgi:hypothetical protein
LQNGPVDHATFSIDRHRLEAGNDCVVETEGGLAVAPRAEIMKLSRQDRLLDDGA